MTVGQFKMKTHVSLCDKVMSVFNHNYTSPSLEDTMEIFKTDFCRLSYVSMESMDSNPTFDEFVIADRRIHFDLSCICAIK